MQRNDNSKRDDLSDEEIANRVDRVMALVDVWLTRDKRISPIVLLDEPSESEQSKLRRDDEARRNQARRELTETGKSVAAAIARLVTDQGALIKLIDCAERDDQIGGMSARLGARLLLQQLVYRLRSKRGPRAAIEVENAGPIRADCVRHLDLLLAAVEDGKPGRELDVVRPLAWKVETALSELGYDYVPIRFELDERDGWCTSTFEISYPWGGSQSVLLSRYRLSGKPGDQIREHVESFENSVTPECREDILRVLRAWQRELTRPEGSASLESQSPSQSAAATDQVKSEIATLNRLTDRQRGIMLTLLKNNAFDRNSRMRTDDVAKAAEGPAANPAGFKRPVADLSYHGLTESLDGREGGIWLSDSGRSLAERLKGRPSGQVGAA